MKLEMIPGKVWRFHVWWMDGFCEKKTSILPRFSRLAGVYIDGNEVVIQLKINPLTTEFSLKSFLGNTLTHETFGFKANENKNLPFILEYLTRFSVCCGLPANNHNDSVVREESDEMCTRTAYLSRKCHQVVPSLGETCVEYGYLKRLLSKRKETYSNIMKIKNYLMGDKQKLVKVNFILKEKKNTGKQNLNLSACVSQMKTTSILNPCWVLWTPPK